MVYFGIASLLGPGVQRFDFSGKDDFRRANSDNTLGVLIYPGSSGAENATTLFRDDVIMRQWKHKKFPVPHTDTYEFVTRGGSYQLRLENNRATGQTVRGCPLVVASIVNPRCPDDLPVLLTRRQDNVYNSLYVWVQSTPPNDLHHQDHATHASNSSHIDQVEDQKYKMRFHAARWGIEAGSDDVNVNRLQINIRDFEHDNELVCLLNPVTREQNLKCHDDEKLYLGPVKTRDLNKDLEKIQIDPEIMSITAFVLEHEQKFGKDVEINFKDPDAGVSGEQDEVSNLPPESPKLTGPEPSKTSHSGSSSSRFKMKKRTTLQSIVSIASTVGSWPKRVFTSLSQTLSNSSGSDGKSLPPFSELRLRHRTSTANLNRKFRHLLKLPPGAAATSFVGRVQRAEVQRLQASAAEIARQDEVKKPEASKSVAATLKVLVPPGLSKARSIRRKGGSPDLRGSNTPSSIGERG